jgi:hypothetical protein
MNYKIKFKALTYRGETVNKTISIEMPEFKEKIESVIVCGNKFNYSLGIEDQVMEYLDNMNKQDLMDKNDWGVIIDYKLYVPKEKLSKVQKIQAFKNLVTNYFNPNFEHTDKLRDDVMVVYIKMYDKIKNLLPEQQFMIVLGTLNIGYAAQSQAYKHAIELIDGTVPKSLKKLGNKENKIS